MLTSLALSLFLAQANMGLTVPTPGVTPGPTYATQISNDLVIIDAHNHAPGNGVPVPTAGLNINANLPFNGFGATGFNSCTGTACGVSNPTSVLVVNDGGGILSPSYSYLSNADIRTTANAPLYPIAKVGDFDSLVDSYLGDRSYQPNGQNTCSSSFGGFNFQSLLTAPQAGSAFSSALDLNPENSASQISEVSGFSLPPGSTGVTVTAYMQKGANDTGTTAIGLFGANCGSAFSSQAFTLTSSMAAYTDTIGSLAVATPYWGGITLNGLGATATSDPVVGPFQIKPTGATGLFSSDFWRVGATAKTLWGNTRGYFADALVLSSSDRAYMVIQTDATQMVVSFENDSTNYSSPESAVVTVGGEILTTIAPNVGTGITQYHTVQLPAGMKEVAIYGSEQFGFTGQFDFHQGTKLAALYLPASATTYVKMAPPLRSLLVWGDSICAGESNPVPSASGWTSIMNSWFNGTVTLECASATSLADCVWNSAGPSLSIPNLSTTVQYISWTRPTDIWVTMGTNDYLHGGATGQFTTLPQFLLAYGSTLDALHQRNPNAQIYAQSLLPTRDESTPNTNGATPPQYRTQQQNACAARPWCTFVDGTTLLSTADIDVPSGVHPLPGSHAKLARNILSVLDGTSASTIAPLNWASSFPAGIQVDGGMVDNGSVLVAGTLTADAGIFAGIANGGTDNNIGPIQEFGTLNADAGSFSQIQVNGNGAAAGGIITGIGLPCSCTITAATTCNCATTGSTASSLCFFSIKGSATATTAIGCECQSSANSTQITCPTTSATFDIFTLN